MAHCGPVVGIVGPQIITTWSLDGVAGPGREGCDFDQRADAMHCILRHVVGEILNVLLGEGMRLRAQAWQAGDGTVVVAGAQHLASYHVAEPLGHTLQGGLPCRQPVSAGECVTLLSVSFLQWRVEYLAAWIMFRIEN